MWRSKKFIFIALLAVVVLAGSIADVAFAQIGTTTTPSDNQTALMARVASILGIDQAKLESAFTQARQEQQAAALDNCLNAQVAAGKITADNAAKYKGILFFVDATFPELCAVNRRQISFVEPT